MSVFLGTPSPSLFSAHSQILPGWSHPLSTPLQFKDPRVCTLRTFVSEIELHIHLPNSCLHSHPQDDSRVSGLGKLSEWGAILWEGNTRRGVGLGAGKSGSGHAEFRCLGSGALEADRGWRWMRLHLGDSLRYRWVWASSCSVCPNTLDSSQTVSLNIPLLPWTLPLL